MNDLKVASTHKSKHEQADFCEFEDQSCLMTLWSAIVSDLDTGVAIIRNDGLVLFINDANRQLWTPYGEPTMEYEGRTVHQSVPLEFADHVIDVIQRVTEQQKTVVIRTIWRGKQLKTTVRFLEPPSGELPRIIAVTRHAPGAIQPIEDFSNVEMIETSVADLGPLDVLTPRQLEVLALIGQGLRTSEIAEMLFRSQKTIETHRTSIRQRLFPRGSNRIELAKLVFDAGLRLGDAQLQRVSAK